MNFILSKRIARGICLFGAALALSAPRISLAQANLAEANRVALTQSVPAALKRATLVKHLDPQSSFRAIIAFNFRDPKAAQAYADAVSDPNSPLFRQFLTPQEIGERFGPDPADYQAVKAFAAAQGLRVAKEFSNRMTVTLEGTVSQVEKAFGTTVNEYRESQQDYKARLHRGAAPLVFRSNATPIKIPSHIAHAVSGILGLNNYARPIPLGKRARKAVGPLDPAQLSGGYNVTPMYTAAVNHGAGRSIAISNWDGEDYMTNAPLYISAFGLPIPAGGELSNIHLITLYGGNGTSGQGEGDLDYQMMLSMAPLANIYIYDDGGGTGSTDILMEVLQQEVSDNIADVISESYGWQGITGSNATPYHNEHTMMTMQGQTYCAASGDYGNAGAVNDGLWYPAIDPNVLVVGGTCLTVTSANAWSAEVGWGTGNNPGSSGGAIDSTGTFAQPSYQAGRGISASLGGRGFPDIAAQAAGANSNDNGAVLLFYEGSETAFDGTSCASPMNAGALAVTEEYLISIGKLAANSAGKYRLGLLNTALYAFNGRNDVFHDITSGNNGYACTKYWDLVTGWGSLNYYNLAAALANPLAVSVTPQGPTIHYGQTQQCAAAVTGSNVTTVTWSLVSGPTGSSVSSAGLFTAPATGTVTTTAVVQAAWTGDYAAPGASAASTLGGTTTITITPLSAAGTVSGTITLQGAVSETGQQITFNLVPTTGTTITKTITLPANGAYTLPSAPAGTYTLKVKGSKWLQTDVAVVVAGNVTGVNATLLPGDINGDNVINLTDFNAFVASYGLSSGATGYNANADLNCDGQVDLTDFNLLAQNYGLNGDP